MAPPNLPFDPQDALDPAPVGGPSSAPAPVPPSAPMEVRPPRAAASDPSAVVRSASQASQTMQASADLPQITAMPRPAGAKGEPEDIFSDLEAPKNTMTPPPSRSGGLASAGVSRGSSHTIIAVIALLVAFGTLGAALWFFVLRKAEPPLPSSTTTEQLPSSPVAEPPTSPEPTATETPYPVETTPYPVTAPVTTPPEGVNIPPPTLVTGEGAEASSTASTTVTAPVPETDTDGDGLSDRRETELGLNPQNPDGDADGLTDGQEVLEYSTNPSNADTDGDSFSDGQEVGNGYDPRGYGKCANPDCKVL